MLRTRHPHVNLAFKRSCRVACTAALHTLHTKQQLSSKAAHKTLVNYGKKKLSVMWKFECNVLIYATNYSF